MSGSYNLNSTISSNIHFSQVVELEIVDESRVYFTVKGIEGRYSCLITSILVAEYPVEIGDVAVGDKMLFVVYKDGKFEGRLETYSGIVEGKDENGLDISIQEEMIKLSFNQLKGDLSKVRIGHTAYLRRRNGRYFKGYFRYYAEQTRPPSDPSTSLDQQFSTIDLKSAFHQHPPLDSIQPNAKSKATEVQDHYEEVQVMINCELCKENKVADNFTIEKVCKCDICDDCVLEVRKNSVKCKICYHKLYDRNVEICSRCGKIDKYENGMMPGCKHFLCKDCSKSTLTYDIDNLIFPLKCSICQSALQPSDYSHIWGVDKIQEYIEYKKRYIAQLGGKRSECGICRIPYSIDEIRTLLCDHSFCNDCMITYILSWLDNTIRPLAVTCPQCPMEISPVTIQALMPTAEFDIYSRKCYNASLTCCVRCRDVVTLSNDDSCCTNCNVRLCKICSQIDHEGDCDPSIMRALKSASHRDKAFFKCPSCKHEYFDSQIREKAVCIKCLTKFCLECYRLYNPIQVHGYHFHSSRCTRYKPTYKQDQFKPNCINCRQKGSLCCNRAVAIKIDP